MNTIKIKVFDITREIIYLILKNLKITQKKENYKIFIKLAKHCEKLLNENYNELDDMLEIA